MTTTTARADDSGADHVSKTARSAGLTTKIASHDLHHIWVRGHDLTADLMGHSTFTDVVFLLIGGRLPAADERAMLDAVLVALMEHGLTPSAAVSRMTYAIAPEALQGAVAAGLLGAGSLLLGSMEECGMLLTRIEDEAATGMDREESVERIVAEYRAARKHIPGIGHSIHTEGDPRATRLYALADQYGRRGAHLDALELLAAAAARASKRTLPINATGAISAILLELGVPWRLHRGFALISRTAGLIAHIGEEADAPITNTLRRLLREGEHSPTDVD
jgi:citrate synthase